MAAEVREMVSDEEVASTFLVMRQLRSHLGEGGYVERIRGMRQGVTVWPRSWTEAG